MSFATRPIGIYGGGTGPVAGAYVDLALQFNGDGTMGSNGHYTGPANWYEAPFSGAGDLFWVRPTKTSGSRSVSGVGVFTKITSAGLALTVTGGAGNCLGTLDFSNDGTAGGIVATGSFNVNNTL